ncbi:MAG: glutathione S-transferase family protein [Caulobacteraceae bacterium]|nr:glutathione S-transferase family protein [Caulobacteraceae bacterium]
MTDFTIHTVPGSPFARAVMIALEEKGLPWRLAPLAPGQLRQPAHLARHPFGRMPAVEHGDFTLYETQAILRYVDRLAPTPPLTPADRRAAARMDQLMNISDWYLFQGAGNVIAFERVVGPRLLGRVPDEAAIAAAMPKAHQAFDEIGRLLAGKPFLAGDAFTLADAMVAPQMAFLALTPEWAALTTRNANLAPWLERMEARPNFKATTWELVADLAKAA